MGVFQHQSHNCTVELNFSRAFQLMPLKKKPFLRSKLYKKKAKKQNNLESDYSIYMGNNAKQRDKGRIAVVRLQTLCFRKPRLCFFFLRRLKKKYATAQKTKPCLEEDSAVHHTTHMTVPHLLPRHCLLLFAVYDRNAHISMV